MMTLVCLICWSFFFFPPTVSPTYWYQRAVLKQTLLYFKLCESPHHLLTHLWQFGNTLGQTWRECVSALLTGSERFWVRYLLQI